MPKWNLGNTSYSNFYWGRVKKSEVRAPSKEYQERAQGRAGDQWSVDIEPLYPYQYHEHGTRTVSQNLPLPGQAVNSKGALKGALDAYGQFGFHFETEEDFGKIEGHVFYFEQATRHFEAGRGGSDKNYDWPVGFNDEFVVPDDVFVYPPRDATSNGASGGGDPWKLAADLLNGKTWSKTIEMQAIIGAGNPQLNGHAEIMTLVNMGQLTDKLVEIGLVSKDKGGKISLVGAGAPRAEGAES